ncbi:hypothetical protein AQUCO_01800038v1 [Aquilegia coerulea]|uniref:F-box domain-containing protein n=1 Tax=Aquilegia coerulea TaxID=218851 RepID=A0A2G5DJL6_AQUCA|nr:hypothetical protein AQUCO_01800038v1 [Aquilegia coerulea]
MKKRIRRKNNVKGSWSDIPNHLLLAIFGRLDRKDVFWRVSSVCRSWQLACWDFFFWKGRNRILKLNELESLCNSNIVEDEFDKLGFALKKVIDSIFKYNSEILEHIHRHFYHLMLSFQLSDKLLAHVAERRCRRALEDIRITRSRRAFAANPPRFVQDPLMLKLSVIKSSDFELVSGRQRQGSDVELVSDKQRQGSGDELVSDKQKYKKYAMFTMDVMWILTAEQMQRQPDYDEPEEEDEDVYGKTGNRS